MENKIRELINELKEIETKDYHRKELTLAYKNTVNRTIEALEILLSY